MSGPTWKTYGPYPGKGTITITVQFAPGGVLTDATSTSCTGLDPSNAPMTLTLARATTGTYTASFIGSLHGAYRFDVTGTMPGGKVEAQSILVNTDVSAT